jgi:hypothetical protein
MNWKMFRLAAMAAVLGAGIGCGGLNGSYNVSPASFFLPGIGQVTPPAGSTNSPSHILASSQAVQ